jgi:hypothetical protein
VVERLTVQAHSSDNILNHANNAGPQAGIVCAAFCCRVTGGLGGVCGVFGVHRDGRIRNLLKQFEYVSKKIQQSVKRAAIAALFAPRVSMSKVHT